MYDVLVKNGRIVTADSVSEGNIAIRDGKIAAVLNAGEEPEAAKVIDAKGNYVFPGAIDTHAHLNDPGYEWREDYEHGTAAAALGGYTTVIDMPLQNEPAMVNAEAFDFKVVVLSGTENFQYAKQAIELSVDGYIMKPIRPLELKRALMQICEKMRNEYWLNASFTVENLLIGCMNGQYQPENKLNEITVRNYGFTVEDSCGMFILWLGEDFEKNKAEAVHLLKRSLQKENKFRVCILPLEVWQEIFVIVYQTAEFEMAEQYFQENIVPMLCSNLNGDVVCVWKRIDHMMDLWQYRTKIPLLRQWNLTLGRGVLISEKGIAGRELELLPLKYPAELELRARDCTLAGRKKELEKCFEELCEMFPIERKKKIINMSKGMQRQASLILAFAAKPKYLFLDEIFDGLDPLIRKTLKTLIIQDVTDRNMTCIIASHNLREIDDICDRIVMLHDGSLLTNEETDSLKNKIHKIQMAFKNSPSVKTLTEMNVQIISQVGNYFSVMARGDIDEIMEKLNSLNPVFIETMPSTLEEVFINEMEGAGYGK